MPKRPAKSSGGNWVGFKPVAISGVIDKSTEFEQFDVLIDFDLKVEGTEYNNTMSLLGTFERNDNNDIEDNSFLKRIYRIFDGLGDQGGVDIKGNWVDSADKKIENIGDYLSQYVETSKYPYLAYLYRERSKKNGKVYTRAYPILVPNTSQGSEDIRGFINFLLKNKVIKIADESSNTTSLDDTPQPTTAFKNQF